MKAAIIGARGYNGRTLAGRLAKEGHSVAGFVRDKAGAPEGLDAIVEGDAVTGDGVKEVLHDADIAYYFIHSLDRGDASTDERDQRAAREFVTAAQAVGLPKAVFFSIFEPPAGVPTTAYQRNRRAVEDILHEGIPGMITLRAGMVLGSGSRGVRPYLKVVQKLPVLPLGPWRTNRFAVVDPETVQDCFVAAATMEGLAGSAWDIPASGQPTHAEFARTVADILGVRRPIAGIPFSVRELETWLLTWLSGDSYNYSKMFFTSTQYDYLVDPARSRPFAAIIPRPWRHALATTIRTWEDTPHFALRAAWTRN